MKTVRYDYSLKEIAAMIADHENVPDGWWQVGVMFEQLASYIPAMSGQQDPEPYPGAIARVVGLTLTPIELPPDTNWYPHAIEVRNGNVIMERTNGPDTNNSGPEPSGESPRRHLRIV